MPSCLAFIYFSIPVSLISPSSVLRRLFKVGPVGILAPGFITWGISIAFRPL